MAPKAYIVWRGQRDSEHIEAVCFRREVALGLIEAHSAYDCFDDTYWDGQDHWGIWTAPIVRGGDAHDLRQPRPEVDE